MLVRRRWMILIVGVLAAALVPAGPSPVSAAPVACHVVWTTNYETSTVQALDLDTSTYGSPIAVEGNPQSLAVTPDGRTVVTAAASGLVTVVDVATRTATPVSVVEHPGRVAITPDGTRAYVTSQGASTGFVTRIDLATRTAGPPIEAPGALAIAMLPDGDHALVGGAGAVYQLDLTTDTLSVGVPLLDNPVNIAVSPDGATAYLTLPFRDELQPLAIAGGTLGTAIAIPGSPFGLALASDGATAYVGTLNPATLVPVDLATSTAGAPLVLPARPGGTTADDVAVSPDGRVIAVGSANSNDVFAVALPAFTLGAPIPNGPFTPPTSDFALAFDPACNPLAFQVPPTTSTTATTPTTTPVVAPAVAPVVVAPNFTG